jgi:hypothetical protein
MAYRPAQFVLAVQSLRPGTEPLVDFMASDEGAGPFISAWLRADLTQPTAAEIEAVDTDALLETPQSILSQDLMAQFTAADATAIQAAVTGNVQFWLLWSAMQAQKDPMIVTSARFLAGWDALVQVLGQARMDAIAAALGVTVS